MKIPKSIMIVWILILVIVLITDVFIYYDVAKADTNNSDAIELYPEGIPEFQFRLITLDNVINILIGGTAIIMSFVSVILYKLRNLFKYL